MTRKSADIHHHGNKKREVQVGTLQSRWGHQKKCRKEKEEEVVIKIQVYQSNAKYPVLALLVRQKISNTRRSRKSGGYLLQKINALAQVELVYVLIFQHTPAPIKPWQKNKEDTH